MPQGESKSGPGMTTQNALAGLPCPPRELAAMREGGMVGFGEKVISLFQFSLALAGSLVQYLLIQSTVFQLSDIGNV